MKLNTANEDSLKFNITIPALSYKLKSNETLTFRFEKINKCVHEENTFNCRSECLKESDSVIHEIRSPSKSFFEHTFYRLKPNWQYKFRMQVKKLNFNGDLHALLFFLPKIKYVLLTFQIIIILKASLFYSFYETNCTY